MCDTLGRATRDGLRLARKVRPGDVFELVDPSIPGYGFSERPTVPMGPAAVGDVLTGLMSALGHGGDGQRRFGVLGGDIG